MKITTLVIYTYYLRHFVTLISVFNIHEDVLK